MYQSDALTFDGFEILGDKSTNDTWTFGINGNDYYNKNLTIKNGRVEGFETGFAPTHFSEGVQKLQNVVLRNKTDVYHHTMFVVGIASWLTPRRVVLEDCTFDGSTHIHMAFGYGSAPTNLVLRDELIVTRFNKVATDNFQPHYDEQRPDFVVPQSDPSQGIIGAPVAGLTNAQCMAQHGLAIAGAVLPANAVARPGVVGKVVSL